MTGEMLVAARARRAVIAASCSSTFMLAESGVPDGFGATTSWWLAPTFRARYPAVHLEERELVVDAARAVTAGAAFARRDRGPGGLRRRARLPKSFPA